MSKLTALVLAALICALARPAQAEVRSFRKQVTQVMGSAMSEDDARTTAIALAKREALEEAGTYLESISVVRNANLERDEILALSSGVLSTEVINEQPFLENGVFGIRVVAEVQVDTAVLDKRIQKQLADRQGLAQLKAAQQREAELLAKIQSLQAENALLTKGKTSPEKADALKAGFNDAATRLTAKDWYLRAWALWDGNKYTRPEIAENYLNKAIILDSNFAYAYNNRGIAKMDLRRYEDAIGDFDDALRLKPNDAHAFNNRGIAYRELHQFKRAVSDFDEALRLDSSYAPAYNNRGLAYGGLGNFQQAIAEFDHALRLNPNYAAAYFNRGLTLSVLQKFNQAVSDFSQSLRLEPNDAAAFASRGRAYAEMQQFDLAMADYDDALRLNPRLAPVYELRGISNEQMGHPEAAYRDWRKACDLGIQSRCAWLAQHPGPSGQHN
jgi:tetratricopeptide (TPR) repeat protein